MRGQFSSIHNILLVEAPDFRSPLHLISEIYTVGRNPSNTIVIYSPKLSRKHAYFYKKTSPNDPQVVYCVVDGDLQGNRSTNGLWVNGKQYFSRDLRNGDVICLSDDVAFKYYVIKNPLEILNLETKFANTLKLPNSMTVQNYANSIINNDRVVYA